MKRIGILNKDLVPFGITLTAYILLTAGVQYLIRSTFFREFVEQNQSGLFKQYFDTRAGYDVLGSVVSNIGSDVLFGQQLLAVLAAIILWRWHKGIAIGLMVLPLAFLTMFLCWALTLHRGY